MECISDGRHTMLHHRPSLLLSICMLLLLLPLKPLAACCSSEQQAVAYIFVPDIRVTGRCQCLGALCLVLAQLCVRHALQVVSARTLPALCRIYADRRCK
jgi:hypothetical protein